MICLSFDEISGANGVLLRAENRTVRARTGMRVRRSHQFPVGEETGRVGNGVGIIRNPDSGIGNVTVYWPADGDITLWTRASLEGFDLAAA